MRSLLMICLLSLPFLSTAQDFISFPRLLAIAADEVGAEVIQFDELDWQARPQEVENALEEAGVSFKPYRAHERMPKTSFKQGDWKVKLIYVEKGMSQVEMGMSMTGERSETEEIADRLAQSIGEEMGSAPNTEQRRNGQAWSWKSKHGVCALIYRYSEGTASLSISCQDR